MPGPDVAFFESSSPGLTGPRDAADPPAPDASALRAAQDRLRSADRLLQLSTALVGAGRVIDLRGLDQAIGRLVASILDLEPGSGQTLLAGLIGLLSNLDRLHAAMLAALPGPDEPRKAMRR